MIRAADDRDDEVEIGRLIHEFEPVIGRIGEQVLNPGASDGEGRRGSPGRRLNRKDQPA